MVVDATVLVNIIPNVLRQRVRRWRSSAWPPSERCPKGKNLKFSLTLQFEGNLALVKQALGHRSINSTMQYVGTTDAQAAEVAQAALTGLF